MPVRHNTCGFHAQALSHERLLIVGSKQRKQQGGLLLFTVRLGGEQLTTRGASFFLLRIVV